MAAELSTDHRLHLAAIDRMNDQGHAIFEARELRWALARIDADGMRKPLSRQAVLDAKKKLHLAGILVENTGGETCIWLATARRSASGKPTRCPVHWKCKATPIRV